ncbi:hypothetical protein ASG93_06845 [Paenibacillus sp. Soil787]|nr:hypothetical protein ASG93_06845 [Paenibacillus sp. Soil787]
MKRPTINAKVQIFLLKPFEKRKSLLLCRNFLIFHPEIKKDRKSLHDCRNLRIGAIQRKKHVQLQVITNKHSHFISLKLAQT